MKFPIETFPHLLIFHTKYCDVFFLINDKIDIYEAFGHMFVNFYMPYDWYAEEDNPPKIDADVKEITRFMYSRRNCEYERFTFGEFETPNTHNAG